MKILLITFDWYGGLDKYVKTALETCGEEVVVYNYERAQLSTLRHRILNRLKKMIRLNKIHDHNIICLAKETRPDLIVIIKGATISADTYYNIKHELKIPFVVWWVDNPLAYAQSYPDIMVQLELADIVYCFDEYYIGLLKELGFDNLQYLPNAGEPTYYRPESINNKIKEKYGSTISFIGTAYPDRVKLLKELGQYDLKVWGVGWGKSLLNIHCHDGVLNAEEVNLIFNASQININLHHYQCISSPNQRIFDIALSGGFQLAPRKSGIMDIFEEDKEMAYFSSLNELKEKINKYIVDTAAAKMMAKAARAKVLSAHTYQSRMKELLGYIKRR